MVSALVAKLGLPLALPGLVLGLLFLLLALHVKLRMGAFGVGGKKVDPLLLDGCLPVAAGHEHVWVLLRLGEVLRAGLVEAAEAAALVSVKFI